MAKKTKSQQRLDIAISLLQGKLVLRERDGYDPGGFRNKEIERTVGGALDMADELLKQNKEYDVTITEVNDYSDEEVEGANGES